ncbi:MAG: inositol monophosphatase [Bacteroidetes bacterium]|jgi:myo-inositol-1(or 4)-monophosphatase|nr:inositol monophosphatase [Bacteroidota bacterium]
MLTENQVLQIDNLIRETGKYIQSQAERVSEKDVHSKDLNSFVSYVDKEAEKKLVQGLEEIHSGFAFLTEENTVLQTDGPARWIIDPLDGTTNFLHGLPAYAVSVALELGSVISYGWVYHISADNLYFAKKNHGAYINGSQIKVSASSRLADGLIATGFPYTDFTHQDAYMKLLAYLMPRCRGLRRWGSAAIDLAFTAAGKFQGFYEVGLSPWDVAAGALLVQEAGGHVTDFSGEADFMARQQILASPPNTHEEMLQQIQTFFPSRNNR